MAEPTVPPETSAPEITARAALRRVLANKNLRRVQLAFFGSGMGDWAYATAVTVWAYSVGGATATGNSFAAPHVAGMVALMLAKRPGLTSFQVKAVLQAPSGSAAP